MAECYSCRISFQAVAGDVTVTGLDNHYTSSIIEV